MDKNASTTVCSLCKRRPAFFFRPYSGEKLCQKCFIESIENKVRAAVSKNHMFNFDDRIAVAVSGGKDSINLLHILAKLERHHREASLVAVTVDEGIKGYRDEALQIAAANCQVLGVEHHVVSFRQLFGFTLDQLLEKARRKCVKGLTSCAYCGVLRRRALNVGACEVEADKIATAHTLDDEVQTVLMNIFRGDLSRLVKEKPVTDDVHPGFVRKVKPFCEVPERESTLYAFVKGVRFQDVPCPYAAEAMRNDVRALLNRMEERHAGTKYAVFRLMERVRPGLAAAAGGEGFMECVVCGEPASSALCRTCELLRLLG